MKGVGKTFRQLRLKADFDPNTGAVSLTPSFDQRTDTDFYLDEIMSIFEKYSLRKRIVVAFDEFQEVGNYGLPNFEAKLRSHIERHQRICYIFSGSQRHMLSEMFNRKSRAFYKLADSFPIGKIRTEHYVPWARNLFSRSGIDIGLECITDIVSRFDNHPMYIQQFLFHLWNNLVMHKKSVSTELINTIEKDIIEKHQAEYETLWVNLTQNQKKILKLVVLNDGKNLFSSQALIEVELKTASSVTKGLEALLKKEIISKNGGYTIQDVIFKKWLIKNLHL
ncbi:MAG: AAA family ATPase [Desulfobacteraceae bacterium]|nr:AAA family ATPase [Desulfobacteraceae bacterium]